MKIKRLLLLLVVLLACNTHQFAQKLSQSETLKLHTSTKSMDKPYLEHLIAFVLTKNKIEYDSAAQILKTQFDNASRLKNNGSGDWQLMYSVEAALNIYDSMKSIYGDYFRDKILKDETKASDFEYRGSIYQVSKMRKSEFKELQKALKELDQ